MSVDVERVFHGHLGFDDEEDPGVGRGEGDDVGGGGLVADADGSVEESGVRPVDHFADAVQGPAEDGAVRGSDSGMARREGFHLGGEGAGVDGCGDDGDEGGGWLVGAGVGDGGGFASWEGG